MEGACEPEYRLPVPLTSRRSDPYSNRAPLATNNIHLEEQSS